MRRGCQAAWQWCAVVGGCFGFLPDANFCLSSLIEASIRQVIFWLYYCAVSVRRSRLRRGGILARSLSGGPPGSRGGSRPFLAGAAEFLASGVTVVPSSSCRRTLRSELWTCKISPTSWLIKPSFLNRFMKKLTRERVVPTISARV